MLGYVQIQKSELKIREYDIYSAYYCGICKSIAKRYGDIPRVVLSYDAAFLAIILGSLDANDETITRERCAVHWVNKRTVAINNDAIDYAADIMIILAYYKMVDNVQDERKLHFTVLKTIFNRYYKRAEENNITIASVIKTQLEKQSQAEREKNVTLDEISECFATIMQTVFSSYQNISDSHRRILGEIGRQLGKWIYIVDAVDDLEKDILCSSYNPLIYRYVDEYIFEFQVSNNDEIITDNNQKKDKNENIDKYEQSEIKEINGYKINISDFAIFVRNKIGDVLIMHLAHLTSALDLLQMKRHSGIIENIVLMGLRKKTEDVLKKGNMKND